MGRSARALLPALLCAGVAATASTASAVPRQLEDPQQCRPFAAADDPQAKLDDLRANVLPLMGGLPAAQHLFDEYLTPAAATAAREDVTDPTALADFRRAAATVAAQRSVLAQLRAKLKDSPPRLARPGRPAGGSLAQKNLGAHLDISYPLGYNTPGLIAGGTGSVDSAAGTFSDDRSITGRYVLRPAATRRGVLRRVTLALDAPRLTVEDSIDFCPGGLGGAAGTALGTLTMSRLERTPHPAGGTYAKPILWRLQTRLDRVTTSVTSFYPGNDRDRDGRPDRQPWTGAHFALDPCPKTRRCVRVAAAGAATAGVGIRLHAALD
jgi:hypothetical protein